MEDLFHDITLIGMKVDRLSGIQYYTDLPKNFIKCTNINDFFKLKKGKRNRIKENLEVIIGMEYLVYSPTSKLYYYKTIHEYTNMWQLYAYFKDANVYIYTDEIRVEKTKLLYPEIIDSTELLY